MRAFSQFSSSVFSIRGHRRSQLQNARWLQALSHWILQKEKQVGLLDMTP